MINPILHAVCVPNISSVDDSRKLIGPLALDGDIRAKSFRVYTEINVVSSSVAAFLESGKTIEVIEFAYIAYTGSKQDSPSPPATT
mmetsp:Transcript_20543/g.42782  ORF Transcript_20543/g.42782 Transcript_20543/m.42782 type:complete len:86 (+) Transcript_20543:556-813(+)